MTTGVSALDPVRLSRLLELLRAFNAFDEGNDPYGEHDFGALEDGGQKFFWKIDLYEDPDVKDDNGNPAVTRVLTIMLAEEY